MLEIVLQDRVMSLVIDHRSCRTDGRERRANPKHGNEMWGGSLLEPCEVNIRQYSVVLIGFLGIAYFVLPKYYNPPAFGLELASFALSLSIFLASFGSQYALLPTKLTIS